MRLPWEERFRATTGKVARVLRAVPFSAYKATMGYPLRPCGRGGLEFTTGG